MIRSVLLASAASVVFSAGAFAGPFTFDNGAPDGRAGLASCPNCGASGIEIETADDFILSSPTLLTGATFTGLLPAGTTLGSIGTVGVEIYRVFPLDSVNPPSGNVPTRVNSPSDNAFDSRDSGAATLTFTSTLVNASFTVANSIVNGINKSPNQHTGGEGPVTAEEVLFTLTFTTPLNLPADHYFFKPEVQLPSGAFLWLSSPRSGPTFTGDLQAWIRNTNLDPDWLRAGTDIIGGATPPTFNEAFTLSGVTITEPSTMLLGLGGIAFILSRRARRSGR